MKYFIIAGEASGDLHGSNLIKELKKADKQAEIQCWGGDLMEQAGAMLLKHYESMAYMGLGEVLLNLHHIWANFNNCKKHISGFNPDLVILIDYGGFNLRMAKIIKNMGIKLVYYISPKLWAWNQARALKIKKYVDLMLCILPFEVDFYKKFNYKAFYVGNPVLDAVENFKRENPEKDPELPSSLNIKKPIIALLAGSRKQEIDLLLPVMVEVSRNFPGYDFVVAGAPSIAKEYYDEYLKGTNITIIYNQTYKLLQHAHAAIVTSGTATLETALFRVPEVVVYQTSKFNYSVGRHFVKVDYISLVNLILDAPALKEVIQFNMVEETTKELDKILNNKDYRKNMEKNLDLLREKLGSENVSAKAASYILESGK